MSYTDFHKYSHDQLRKMVQAMNSGEVMAASDPWRRAAGTLKLIRASLTTASTDAATSWEGPTSEAFHSRMLHLASTINNAASYANDAAITLQAMAEAIDEAKRTMPEEPSNWEKVKDGVGDTLSATFGGDDEDTKTSVTDQRKAEAVAVMQTLAAKYRTAAPMLKPPPPPPPPPGGPVRNENRDVVPNEDSGATGGIGAMMTSMTSMGTSRQSSGGSVKGSAPAPQTPPSVKASTPKNPSAGSQAPTDSGIKGGTAQPVTKLPTTTTVGPGTGLNGTNPTVPTSTGPVAPTPVPSSPGPAVPGPPGGGPGGGGFNNNLPLGGNGQKNTGPGGPGGGNQPIKGGMPVKDPMGRADASSSRSGATFGSGGVQGGGAFGPGGGIGPGSRSGGSTAKRAGNVVGGEDHAAGGAGGKRAFTEGGSGLGARGRGRGGLGAAADMAAAVPGMPIGTTQRRKKDEEQEGRRPDYLVEDEETWASDKPQNPNVVE